VKYGSCRTVYSCKVNDMRGSFVLLFVLVGCDDLEGVLGARAPVANLERVALVRAPKSEELLGYGCAQALGDGACATVGLEAPARNELSFSFDLVFSLSNPNAFPVPLVETLLGFSAFDQDNLGSVCVSFCDPGDPSCEPAIDAKGACDPEGSRQVAGPEDLIPTVDDLVRLAEGAASGEAGVENGEWRVIDPFGSTESHVQFDLGIDPLLQIADDLLNQALNDVFAGQSPTFDVPYTVEGTLFFDVPTLGRHAVGFGPLSDRWELR
jgi:hypothetical protein